MNISKVHPLIYFNQQQKQKLRSLLSRFNFTDILQVFNLKNLYPYADEYTHLLAAKELLAGASQRCLSARSFVVTCQWSHLIRFLVRVYGLRACRVLFNVLGIVPLFDHPQINRQIAIFSCLCLQPAPTLFLFPNIQEYAYYPLYFYGVVYFMVFSGTFPVSLCFQDWKTAMEAFALLLLLLLPILHVLFFDVCQLSN
jgi:hypothetical protein